ncbi:MAG: hypothetical protein AAF747_08565 [Planctomycetota bacterium]
MTIGSVIQATGERSVLNSPNSFRAVADATRPFDVAFGDSLSQWRIDAAGIEDSIARALPDIGISVPSTSDIDASVPVLRFKFVLATAGTLACRFWLRMRRDGAATSVWARLVNQSGTQLLGWTQVDAGGTGTDIGWVDAGFDYTLLPVSAVILEVAMRTDGAMLDSILVQAASASAPSEPTEYPFTQVESEAPPTATPAEFSDSPFDAIPSVTGAWLGKLDGDGDIAAVTGEFDLLAQGSGSVTAGVEPSGAAYLEFASGGSRWFRTTEVEDFEFFETVDLRDAYAYLVAVQISGDAIPQSLSSFFGTAGAVRRVLRFESPAGSGFAAQSRSNIESPQTTMIDGAAVDEPVLLELYYDGEVGTAGMRRLRAYDARGTLLADETEQLTGEPSGSLNQPLMLNEAKVAFRFYGAAVLTPPVRGNGGSIEADLALARQTMLSLFASKGSPQLHAATAALATGVLG